MNTIPTHWLSWALTIIAAACWALGIWHLQQLELAGGVMFGVIAATCWLIQGKREQDETMRLQRENERLLIRTLEAVTRPAAAPEDGEDGEARQNAEVYEFALPKGEPQLYAVPGGKDAS